MTPSSARRKRGRSSWPCRTRCRATGPFSARPPAATVRSLRRLPSPRTFRRLLPKAAVIAAGQTRPIPSVHEITAKKDAFLQQIQTESQKGYLDWVQKNRTDAQKDPKAFEEKFRQFLQNYQQEMTSKIDENNSAIERDYQQRKRAQQNLAINMSRISPASALTFGSQTLAKTGGNAFDRILASG